MRARAFWLVAGLFAAILPGVAQAQKFTDTQREDAREMLRLIVADVKKHYYDPNGMINFFEKLQTLEKRRPGVAMKLYGDHPQTPDRIAQSQREIGTILPPRDQYIVSSSEFEQAKKRLALIMKHKLPKDGKDTAKPDLRRTAGDKNPGDPDQNDKNQNSDRPVIKRKPGDK